MHVIANISSCGGQSLSRRTRFQPRVHVSPNLACTPSQVAWTCACASLQRCKQCLSCLSIDNTFDHNGCKSPTPANAAATTDVAAFADPAMSAAHRTVSVVKVVSYPAFRFGALVAVIPGWWPSTQQYLLPLMVGMHSFRTLSLRENAQELHSRDCMVVCLVGAFRFSALEAVIPGRWPSTWCRDKTHYSLYVHAFRHLVQTHGLCYSRANTKNSHLRNDCCWSLH
jgi:hypothetical protein